MFEIRDKLNIIYWIIGIVVTVYVTDFLINHIDGIVELLFVALLLFLAYVAVTHFWDYHEEMTTPTTEVNMDVQDAVDNQMDYINTLNGYQFETYMVKLLHKIGFEHLEHTRLSRDGGLDAIGLTQHGHVKVGFQFKHCDDNISYQAIADTIAGGQLYNTQINYIITTSGYTTDALSNYKQIIHNHPNDNLELLDGADLRYLVELSVEHKEFKPAVNAE